MANILRVFLFGLSLNLLIDLRFIHGRLCDCESIKDLLTEEIFDLKLRNRDLTTRLERLESTTPKRLQGPSQFKTLEPGQVEELEARMSALESKCFETASVEPVSSLPMQSQIFHAFRAEKTMRYNLAVEMKEIVQRLNNSLQNVNEPVASAFETRLDNITTRLSEMEANVSKSIERLSQELRQKDEDQIEKLRTRIADLESKDSDLRISNISERVWEMKSEVSQRIDSLNKDILKLKADMNTVVDITKLKQEASCYPKCENGGVCNKGNTCRCKPTYYGSRCETRKCADGAKIHNTWFCDGEVDCSDGSDERYC